MNAWTIKELKKVLEKDLDTYPEDTLVAFFPTCEVEIRKEDEENIGRIVDVEENYLGYNGIAECPKENILLITLTK